MIKNHRKLIALFVVFAFVCLLQASTMPLRAEQSQGQSETTMKSTEQGPNFVEEEGAPYAAKKKSIVPVVLIGLGVVAVAAVLVLVVFKTKYDITGSWTFVLTATSSGVTGATWNPVTFTGDKKSGTYKVQTYYDGNGTYTVDGKNVSMKSTYYTSWTFTGTFTSKTTISGTSTLVLGTTTYTWSWIATKNATTTQVPSVKAENLGSLLKQLLKK
jgi:hypothetical protein